MEQSELMNALVQAKRMGNLLSEVLDLSRQMAEAVDRDDHVSLQMLVAMRQEPISKLEQTDQTLQDQVDGMADPEQAARLAALLHGEAAGEADEQALASQVASNKRRLQQVIELDKALSRKTARDKSIYQP